MPIPTELLDTILDRLAPNGDPPTPDDAIDVWARLFARFRPLLGPLSTQLLFARALALHESAIPWLPQATTPDQTRQAFDLFARALDGRQPEDVLAANRALLASYATQLAELIGTRLATQFLRSAFPPDDAK